MPGDKSEALQGTLYLMVLKTLASMGPSHGYGIARRVEQVGEGASRISRASDLVLGTCRERPGRCSRG
jgi:hypothetical protein